MAGLLPPGMVWCQEGAGVIAKRIEECTTNREGSGSPSNSPDFIGKPPEFLEGSDNIFRDEGGVIRNLRRDPGGETRNAAGRVTGGGGQDFFSQRTASPNFVSGGGGGGGGGRSFTGSVTFGGGNIRASGFPIGGNVPTPFNPALAALSQQVGQLSPNVTGAGSQFAAGNAPRALFDRYQDLLLNPGQIAQDPAFQLILQQAQQASGRQLAAGRTAKSGGAAIRAAEIAAGNTGQYLRQLSDIYGQGSQQEFQRFLGQAGLAQQQGQGNFRDLLSRAQVQAGLIGQSGTPVPDISGLIAPQVNQTISGPFGPYLAFNPNFSQQLQNFGAGVQNAQNLASFRAFGIG